MINYDLIHRELAFSFYWRTAERLLLLECCLRREYRSRIQNYDFESIRDVATSQHKKPYIIYDYPTNLYASTQTIPQLL